jgi:phosphotransferase system  glucose/maltose/N-acetylglucosamine-specific IIC component
MKKIKNIILILGILMGLGMTFMPVGVGAATDVFKPCTEELKDTAVCSGKDDDDFGDFLKLLVNNLLFILGSIAVLVVIYGGITYSMSAGDPALVTKAKNTIIYAVVGLIVAISAYAVVNFVIKQF